MQIGRLKLKTAIAILLIAGLVLTLTPAFALTGIIRDTQTYVDPILLELADLGQEVEVIVTFWGDGPLTNRQLNLLSNLGISAGIKLNALPIVGVKATKTQIQLLASSSLVRSLYHNSELQYYNEDANEITGVTELRNDPRFRIDGVPVSGRGVTVLVNDSGVDGTHRDHEFGRKLIQNVMGTTNLNAIERTLLPVSWTENIPNTDTNSGHGTHVAGTVAGTGAMSSGKYEGAAPGANLVGYGSGAVLLILDALGGFDYALTHQHIYDIRIITNSWGSTGDFNPHHPINVATKACYDRNMIITFAAGNEGPNPNTHNPYAKAPWVISVAAGTKDGTLTNFSSRGRSGHEQTFQLDGQTWTWRDQPTITAPGQNIISTIPASPLWPLGVSTDIEPAHMPFYAQLSGTSMATPHVAGIIALMLEVNPSLTPDEVKQILIETATEMPGYEAWEVGAGYVNAYAAVESVFLALQSSGSSNTKKGNK